MKPGGVARVMINLANELCERNYDVSILFLIKAENTFYEINPKIKIQTLNSFDHWGFKKINPFLDKYFKKLPHRFKIKKYIYDFGQWDLLNKWLKDNHQKYDTIISCWYKLSAQIATNKLIAKKTIAWEHSNFQVGGKIWGDLLRPKYRNLFAIVCINKASFHYYKTLNKNALLISNIIGEPFESITSIDFSKKKNQLVYVGRLDEEKNVGSLIDVISKTELRDFTFKIIGDGPELENLKNMTNSKNLHSKIFFTGRLSIDEIKNELLASKVFLFMSKKECLPTVLLESLFTGTSIISYDCEFGPSDIINTDNGFLIPMNDSKLFIEKLQNLINSTSLDQLNISTFEDAKHWTKEEVLRKWNTIINH